jgi:hypothetical protein
MDDNDIPFKNTALHSIRVGTELHRRKSLPNMTCVQIVEFVRELCRIEVFDGHVFRFALRSAGEVECVVSKTLSSASVIIGGNVNIAAPIPPLTVSWPDPTEMERIINEKQQQDQRQQQQSPQQQPEQLQKFSAPPLTEGEATQQLQQQDANRNPQNNVLQMEQEVSDAILLTEFSIQVTSVFLIGNNSRPNATAAAVTTATIQSRRFRRRAVESPTSS